MNKNNIRITAAIKRHGRVYREDVPAQLPRPGWVNQPLRKPIKRPEVLRKQFSSTADAEELKTINKRALNEKYKLGIPEADLTNPKITLEDVEAILKKKTKCRT